MAFSIIFISLLACGNAIRLPPTFDVPRLLTAAVSRENFVYQNWCRTFDYFEHMHQKGFTSVSRSLIFERTSLSPLKMPYDLSH